MQVFSVIIIQNVFIYFILTYLFNKLLAFHQLPALTFQTPVWETLFFNIIILTIQAKCLSYVFILIYLVTEITKLLLVTKNCHHYY